MSTVLRLLIVSLMFVTALAAILMDEPLREPRDSPGELEFEWSKLGNAVSIIGFASGYSIMVPPLTSMLKNKSHAIRIQVWVNIAITSLLL
jgi:amino acid permease